METLPARKTKAFNVYEKSEDWSIHTPEILNAKVKESRFACKASFMVQTVLDILRELECPLPSSNRLSDCSVAHYASTYILQNTIVVKKEKKNNNKWHVCMSRSLHMVHNLI